MTGLSHLTNVEEIKLEDRIIGQVVLYVQKTEVSGNRAHLRS